MPRNIFVLGTARSGSTWTTKVLGQAPGVVVIREPDQVDVALDDPGRFGFGPYPMIAPGERSPGYEALWDVSFAGAMPRGGPMFRVGQAFLRTPRVIRDPLIPLVSSLMRRRPRRTVVKSILSCFAAEWIVARYQPTVVVTQRNPLDVVASWVAVDVPPYELWARRDIQQRYLEPLGLPTPAAGASSYELAAWCVGLQTTVLRLSLERNPDWLVVTHEDLCASPAQEFRDLYGAVDLPWSDATDRFLKESNQPGEGRTNTKRVAAEMPGRWRSRIDESQARAIRLVLDAFPSRGWVREPVARSERPA